MNHSFVLVDGKPGVATPEHVNLGLAIDVTVRDGSRQLLVPSIKAAEAMDFRQFWMAYEDIVRRARTGKLTIDDYAGTTITLTNPGTIGTEHSVPRLMAGQGCIVGVGAMEYPAEYLGASQETLARLAVSKTVTLTSTYDHRIIQGAQSGEFLRRMQQLLLGEDGFYDAVFKALHIPYEPVRWVRDIAALARGRRHQAARVLELIHAYRVRGHLMADTDPLEYKQRKHPDLDINEHGLTLWDLEREFPTGGFGGKPLMKLREILGVLRDSYCRTVGVEYMHIQNPEERAWLQERIERPHGRPSHDEQMQILSRLNVAEAFEMFLQTKFVGQRRFSLEGAESLIPLLDAVLTEAGRASLDEAVIGMAHRGRLNVLANIVGKSYAQIFGEFEGNLDPRTTHGSGDVKYHLGADGVFTASDGSSIATSLVANPSHLEAVDPVAEGVVRAKQDVLDMGEPGFTVLAVLIHGDAAFAGQGVVAETLNLSQLRGYRTGGTVHIVVNNQVGFTTSPQYSRSSVYSTDVARMIQAPIFHVNGDDPEAVVRVGRLAFAYRQAFGKDVVIDMICYRRRGPQRGGQPVLHPAADVRPHRRQAVHAQALHRGPHRPRRHHHGRGRAGAARLPAATGARLHRDPGGREPARRAGRGGPAEAAPRRRPIDHACHAHRDHRTRPSSRSSTASSACPTGSPSIRGCCHCCSAAPRWWPTTRSTGPPANCWPSARCSWTATRCGWSARTPAAARSASGTPSWWTGTPRRSTPRCAGSTRPARSSTSTTRCCRSSPPWASSTATRSPGPDALVCWEAQFGDFVNGAQTIMDEFISSGEQKWGQRSSVVLLLPHGYEGQGPDHSSARVERFLSLCAQDNMTVAVPTTPANYFHLLRWQALSGRRKPLIVFTPKSMLRLKAATSAAADFTQGSFLPVIGDPGRLDPAGVAHRCCCAAGKIYYDLAAQAGRRGPWRPAHLIRVERLYPLPLGEILAELDRYPAEVEIAWVQEEPTNMGAWPTMSLWLPGLLERKVRLVAPPASSAPAPGLVHRACRRPQGRSSSAPWARASACTSPTGVSRSLPSGGAARRSASAGSPSGCGSSWTPRPSSRRRSTGSRPGSPGSTTTKTDAKPSGAGIVGTPGVCASLPAQLAMHLDFLTV